MDAYLQPHDFAISALGMNLYPWQADCLAAVGKGYPSALLALNGSGKSSTIITALILWFLTEHPAGRCIVTSGSWTQLQAQVFDSVRRYSHLPLFRGFEFLESSVKTPQGGFAKGISVDEPQKAEGNHKRDGSPVMLIIDEAKAVVPGVFESFGKCNVTYRFICSSAGPASGRFHRIYTTESKYWWKPEKPITYKDCPHLNDQQRLADLDVYGEGSVFYRNRWLSEFATDAGEAVISMDALRDCIAHPPPWVDQYNLTCGCDFAAGGGDQCVFALARGNKIELDPNRWCWRHANTNHSACRFVNLFTEHGLQSHQVFGDAGGLGRGFIDNLEECGYFVREIHNGSRANDADRYASLAAEQWDSFNNLVVKRRLILPNNEPLLMQLSNRQREYGISEGKVRLKLESKQDMKSRGAGSPDIADAAIMAVMCGWGSWPQNLNPSGHLRMQEQIAVCHGMMKRSRSPFHVPPISFDGFGSH